MLYSWETTVCQNFCCLKIKNTGISVKWRICRVKKGKKLQSSRDNKGLKNLGLELKKFCLVFWVSKIHRTWVQSSSKHYVVVCLWMLFQAELTLLLIFFRTTWKHVISQNCSNLAQIFSYVSENTCQTFDWQPNYFRYLLHQLKQSIACSSKCTAKK